MALFRFEEWILDWLTGTDTFLFDWDKGNAEKSQIKHGVNPEEVEEMFCGTHKIVPLGIQTSPKTEEERIGIIGADEGGRILHLVFTIREGRVRPISARPAHRKERSLYEKTLR